MLTISQFRDRFTQDEKRAIYAAAAAVQDVRIWLDDLAAVTVVLDPADQSRVLSGVDLTDPRTVAGVQGLEAAGLIGAGRAAEILDLGAEEFPPVGGFTLGQMVRLTHPWSVSWPGEYPIVGFGPSCVTLEMGQFAPNLIEAV
jgi:hypothetical protein